MFSEALRILNHNTAVLMVDEYRKKYQEMENNLRKEMQEKQKILDDKDRQINSQKEQFSVQKEQYEEQHTKDLERIAELEAMLKESRDSKESNGQG